MAAESTPSEIYVQHIACVNNGGFVASFKAAYEQGGQVHETADSGHFPAGQSRSINLDGHSIDIGASIWPVVHAMAGVTHHGPRVRFAPNGQTATYSAAGTTLHYSVRRL